MPKIISRCKAIYAYTPKLDDELEINPGSLTVTTTFLNCIPIYEFISFFAYFFFSSSGDLIDVHIKQEDGWWVGAIKDHVGIFPATYVEEIV